MNKTNLFPLVDLRINSCNKNVHFCFSTCHDKKKVVDLFTSWPGCFKRVLNFTHTWNSVSLQRRHLKQRLFNQGNFDIHNCKLPKASVLQRDFYSRREHSKNAKSTSIWFWYMNFVTLYNNYFECCSVCTKRKNDPELVNRLKLLLVL